MNEQNPNQPTQEEDISRWELSPPSSPPPPPPPPPTPPPPPPGSPRGSPPPAPSSYKSKPTVARLETRSPRKNSKKKHRDIENKDSTDKNKNEKTVEGGKKKKKKKRTKKSTNANTKPPLGSYGQQYNATGKVPPAISYHNDGLNHSSTTAPGIINYSSPPKASNNQFGSFLSSLIRKDDDGKTERNIDGYGDDEGDTFIRNGNWDTTRNINTGKLNSAGGDGTTIPEVLGRIRMLHLMHVLAVFVLEGYGLLWHIVSFQIERLLWGLALLFLASLLGCFELVRGQATLADADVDSSIKFQDIVRMSSRFGTSASGSAESVIYKTVVGGPRRRKIRAFLQRYACILYSSIGRGLYLCIMAGVAWMHNQILMRVLSISLGCLGVWTTTLRCRYPELDKIFDNQKSCGDEDNGDESSILTGASAGGSIATWSTFVSNASVVGSKSESQHLMT